MFWVDTAPTPGSSHGQRAPTAMLEELMAMPNWPVSGQRAVMEKVMGVAPGVALACGVTWLASSRASSLLQGIGGAGLLAMAATRSYSGITAITSISINHCGCPSADTTNPVEIGNTPLSHFPTSWYTGSR